MKAKEKWYKERCNEMKEVKRMHNVNMLHQKVKELKESVIFRHKGEIV